MHARFLPIFAVVAALLCSAVSEAAPVRLRTGNIYPESTARLQADATGAEYVLIQFDTLPSEGERWGLAADGIQLLRYLPDNAWWARVEGGFAKSRHASSLSNQTLLLPASLIDKVDPALRTKSSSQSVEAHVLFLPGAADAAALRTTGAKFIGWDHPSIARIVVTGDQLAALNALPGVEMIAPVPPPDKTTNLISANRMGTDDLQIAPYNLNGAGVTIGLWEAGGIPYLHTDFIGRVTVVDTTADISDHATHVSGTLVGAGILQSPALGMAPGASILAYDSNSDTAEMRDATLDGLVELSNHSYGTRTGWDYEDGEWTDYGEELFGQYSLFAFAWDQTIVDTGLLVFKSAGNDRNDDPDGDGGVDGDGPYDCITHRGIVKNNITVGALDDLDGMSVFSSWGPADDGRIKPEVSANGVGLYSTIPDDLYSFFSGTSMSTPSVCGTTATLLELYHKRYGSDLAPVETMKAILIDSAKDLGRTGPDYEFGFGIPQAVEAAVTIRDGLFREGVVSNGGMETYTVQVSAQDTVLQATLVWLDPAGSPLASKALVNDLDLTLVSPGGTTYQAWVLDKDNPSNDATTGRNDVDTVEQVVVNDPESGEWTIKVSGFSVPEGPGIFTVVSSAFDEAPQFEGEGGTEGEGEASGDGEAEIPEGEGEEGEGEAEGEAEISEGEGDDEGEEGEGGGEGPGCGGAPLSIDLCSAFAQVKNNPLLGQLDDELQPLIELLDPETADINGDFFVDLSDLNNPVINIQPNGMLDAANELGLVQEILSDECFWNGRVSHLQVRAAWEHNYDTLIEDYVGPNATLLINFVPGIAEVLVAFLVLGDGEITASGPSLAEGTGSFGIVAGLFQVLDEQLAGFLGSGFLNGELDPNDFISVSALRRTSNADLDEYNNQEEYDFFGTRACALKGAEQFDYVDAALRNSIYPGSGIEEGEGDGDAGGEGDDPVDGEADTEGEGEPVDGEAGPPIDGEADAGEGEAGVEIEGDGDGDGAGEGSGFSIHTSDQDGNGAVSLAELLRPIQFYNAGGFACGVVGEGEDEYSVGLGDCSLCTQHASDYAPNDCTIELSELLRIIQFFNLGGYYPCVGGEDGFCAGSASR